MDFSSKSDSDIYISWTEYHQKIEELARQIHRSNWDFEQIICIAKGGLRIGDILARIFDRPLAIISATSYGGTNNQTRGTLTIAEHLTMTAKELGNRLLVIDDLVDSGISLQEITKWLIERYPETITEIRTGVIWYKSRSIVKPDYYIDYLPTNPWIHQPFEIYESFNFSG
jgi:uncharacterized protein